jgi:hypothetical protein
MSDNSTSKEARRESVERQMQNTTKGTGTASPADEQPASEDRLASDAPDSPHGVGESTTRRAEDVAGTEGKEPGRADAGREHESERPTGTSSTRDMTGVDPKD